MAAAVKAPSGVMMSGVGGDGRDVGRHVPAAVATTAAAAVAVVLVRRYDWELAGNMATVVGLPLAVALAFYAAVLAPARRAPEATPQPGAAVSPGGAAPAPSAGPGLRGGSAQPLAVAPI